MIKVLQIGPDPYKSKGGMASVIKGIVCDDELKDKYDIDYFGSYIDSNVFLRMMYSWSKLLLFFFCKKKYDIYHIHMASYRSAFRKRMYCILAKKRGRVIVHIHGGEFVDFFEHLNNRKRRKIQVVLKNADQVITLSESWKEKICNSIGICNCSVVPNGIDVNYYSRGISTTINKNNVICLSKVCKEKGIYDLVDAIEEVAKYNDKVKCIIAGVGEIDKVNDLIEKKGLENNIKLVGWVDGKTKMYYLAKSSILILPSYHEALPMCVLEGMASGKAIVATRVGAIPEIVKEEINGLLVEPGDVSSLAKTIIRLMSNTETLEKYKNANIKKMACVYSEDITHRKLSTVYEMIIENN